MYKEHLTKIILEADENIKLPDWVIKSGNKPKEFEYGNNLFIWIDGIWKNGIWFNGTWIGGTWEKGYWKNGTWKNGTWKNGTWENGIWKNGTWFNGYIWSNKFKDYCKSKINPKEFYKLEKESNNLNELRNKVG